MQNYNAPNRNMKNVVTNVLLVVLVLLVLYSLRGWIMPSQTVTADVATTEEGYDEQFESTTEPVVAPPAEAVEPAEDAGTQGASPDPATAPTNDGNGAYVDAQTGSLIEGPGFEKGEMDDIYNEPSTSIPSNYYFLDDGAGGEASIFSNLCSKSCCSAQWPTPHKAKHDPYVCANKDKFVPKV
jgi:hypothetical protein